MPAPAPRRLAGPRVVLLMLVMGGALAGASVMARRVQGPSPFASQIASLSEPAGYFDTDNLISNERSYLQVVPELRQRNVRGGAYLGVGPDQNFTYIAQIKPRIAFMVDIRRDAMMQHLMFKALFMMSRNRVEYLSNLFARPLPKDHKKWGDRPIRDFIDYFDRTPLDQRLSDRLAAEVRKRIASFGLQLSQRDIETIDEIYQAFYTDCLEVRYTIRDRPTGRFFPAYRDLLLEKDLEGRHRNYLATEADFQVVKNLQDHNLIIPVTADLSGPQAVKAVGAFLKEINEKVSALYVSNVEFYLWRYDTMSKFVENLKALPIDDSSVIIRSYFNYAYYTEVHPQTVGNSFSVQLMQTINSMLEDFASDRPYDNYWDLATRRSLDLKLN